MTRVLSKDFPEKGLHMSATILKSPQATQATISIVETFSKIRELSKSIKYLSVLQDKAQQKSLMQKSDGNSASDEPEDIPAFSRDANMITGKRVLKTVVPSPAGGITSDLAALSPSRMASSSIRGLG
ncbi:MAG: hypothetical protein ABI479_04850 [Gallionella sp.]